VWRAVRCAGVHSSLDKLDLGVAPKHGAYKALIQTDHRSAMG
jgi:hypothetical protein